MQYNPVVGKMIGVVVGVVLCSILWLASLQFGSAFYLRPYEAKEWALYDAEKNDYKYRCQMAASAKKKFAQPGTSIESVKAMLGEPSGWLSDGTKGVKYDLGVCVFERGELLISLDAFDRVSLATLR